jgi:hypothetical protein
MAKLFQTAAGISNQWSLAAFAIAAILYFVLKRRGKIPAIAWACIAAIVLIGLAPILGSVYLEKARLPQPIYRVRVTVLDAQQIPVEDARVWSSMGGEAKKVAGGWQFDIPAASKPADGKLTVYAAVSSAFLTGRRELHLADDRNPAITVQLAKDASATVRGMVVDGSNKAIAGTRVSVAGYEAEAVVTQAGGNFLLPAHAANGQQVQLHAERAGYAAVSQWHPAGDEPATLVLDRK